MMQSGTLGRDQLILTIGGLQGKVRKTATMNWKLWLQTPKLSISPTLGKPYLCLCIASLSLLLFRVMRMIHAFRFLTSLAALHRPMASPVLAFAEAGRDEHTISEMPKPAVDQA
jgi:hypothetical protein